MKNGRVEVHFCERKNSLLKETVRFKVKEGSTTLYGDVHVCLGYSRDWKLPFKMCYIRQYKFKTWLQDGLQMTTNCFSKMQQMGLEHV